jgi:MFS family permease
VGDRLVNLIGTCILGVFVFLNGLASNSSQLIAFRAVQGIGLSLSLPTSVSIMARALPPGRTRSIGFSCLGVAQPVGWSLGLVVEGGIERLTGDWRTGYYICASILAVFFLANLVYLPSDPPRPDGFGFASVASSIDWIGAVLASTGFGLILYSSAYASPDPCLL